MASRSSSRNKTVYIVTDSVTGDKSAWSHKAYAMAEVQALAKTRYSDDENAVGSKVSFSGVASLLCDLPLDSASLVDGTDWKSSEDFADAIKMIENKKKHR